MMFLLDTNVISELRKGKKNQSPKVMAWAGATPSKQCYLSAITVLELEQGVQRLEYETPPPRQCVAHLVERYQFKLSGAYFAV